MSIYKVLKVHEDPKTDWVVVQEIDRKKNRIICEVPKAYQNSKEIAIVLKNCLENWEKESNINLEVKVG